MTRLTIALLLAIASLGCVAQASNETATESKWDYKIYLKKPAKKIEQLLNEKDKTPINGSISDAKNSIIMTNYVPGNQVRIKVVYEDGDEEEFVTSPCYIDPVIP
jgi:hypothetical protein